jgi:Fe2+ transport system protein FeoA
MGRTVRDLRVGETATLGEPSTDSRQRGRLVELGLRPGEQVTLIQRAVGGARVLSVHGSRIALDARTSEQLPIAEGSA